MFRRRSVLGVLLIPTALVVLFLIYAHTDESSPVQLVSSTSDHFGESPLVWKELRRGETQSNPDPATHGPEPNNIHNSRGFVHGGGFKFEKQPHVLSPVLYEPTSTTEALQELNLQNNYTIAEQGNRKYTQRELFADNNMDTVQSEQHVVESEQHVVESEQHVVESEQHVVQNYSPLQEEYILTGGSTQPPAKTNSQEPDHTTTQPSTNTDVQPSTNTDVQPSTNTDVQPSSNPPPPLSPQHNHTDKRKFGTNVAKKEKGDPEMSLCNANSKETAIALGLDPLPTSAISTIEKFLFFVGYPRSGHSMIGSLLDAHPNAIVAHEYFLMQKCVKFLKNNTRMSFFSDWGDLYNRLYHNSVLSARCGWRSPKNTSKGYNFNLQSQWQGNFTRLKMIGDKSGNSAGIYLVTGMGRLCLQQLLHDLGVPVVALHVVRNPYDMIATEVLYAMSDKKHTKLSVLNETEIVPSTEVLQAAMNHIYRQARVVRFAMHLVKVVELHVEDFIKDPDNTIKLMCEHFGLPCPQSYIELCRNKMYKNVSRSRDLIHWSTDDLAMVKNKMRGFDFFSGYTFNDNFYDSNRLKYYNIPN